MSVNEMIEDGPGTKGRSTWKSPSNIAIVKYWGKHGEQLPANPSLSLTLSEAYTITSVDYRPGSGDVRFLFEGNEKPDFAARVQKYVSRLGRDMPVLSTLDLTINSENSFPHSAGIASSASAMSALALCLSSIAGTRDATFMTRASHYARLGSGSACRSLEGPIVVWGKHEDVPDSTDDHGVRLRNVHPTFTTFCDSILIVDKGEKHVKSSVGHALMHNHPYAKQRFERAHLQLNRLVTALETGDVGTFGEIAEAEALDLHAMMMTSSPSFVLLKPGTLDILEKVRVFRESTGLHVYFTLDAGPNVHLLYPKSSEATIRNWIESELTRYCADGMVIHDKVGDGAVQID